MKKKKTILKKKRSKKQKIKKWEKKHMGEVKAKFLTSSI